MPAIKDMTNTRCGRLTVTGLAYRQKGAYWDCVCDCGAKSVVFGYELRSGKTKSCGCLRAEQASERLRKRHIALRHGKRALRSTREYHIWYGIRARCTNPEDARYKNYGARGIQMCDRWLHGEGGLTGIECFVADMGLRPSAKHSVDRIDNEGHYEPSNCRWATSDVQRRNSRQNRYFVLHGERLILSDLSRVAGVSQSTILGRLAKGETVEQACDPARVRWSRAARLPR